MELLYVSGRFLEILGITGRELEEEYQNQMVSLIHPGAVSYTHLDAES